MIYRFIKSLCNWHQTYRYVDGQWNQANRMKHYKKHLKRMKDEGVRMDI